MRRSIALMIICAMARGADLPIHEIVLYKHGVAYFEREGDLKAGETARLDFKAEDMNDVLKSLMITLKNGGEIGGVRYDASEPLEKRLQNFPFALGEQASLSAFLDQMKGARLELKLGSETVAGTIVSARLLKSAEKEPAGQKEIVVLLGDDGQIRSFDLASASSVSLPDPKLQGLLRDYLVLLSGARSKDKRSVFIDSSGAGVRQLVARYMTSSPVWKSSYRLIFGSEARPMLEGWAIVDNTSGEDWENVKLSVVSGRPISFITQLYEPRYVRRAAAELAENNAIAPPIFDGAVATGALAAPAPPNQPLARAQNQQASAGYGGGGGGRGGAFMKSLEAQDSSLQPSSVASTAEGENVGALFEYSFATPVTVKKGESAMLPFLQQPTDARKLLIYSDSMNQHPMNAAEIANTTGKTLDGGPITVYEAGAYAGEALVETLKAGDKRLIAYGVDLGTRISTAWDSAKDVVREIHLRRGMLTSRSAIQESKTYTIKNVDLTAKTLVIEHPERNGYKLLNQKPSERTAGAYRFEVQVPASGNQTFTVQEERLNEQTVSVSNAPSDLIATWLQNKALSDPGRAQLQRIAQKKKDISDNDAALQQVTADQQTLAQDQDRFRRNLQSLNAVSGQQDQVQQYARQLAASEVRLAALRDSESQLRRRKTTLQADLNDLIEKADF